MPFEEKKSQIIEREHSFAMENREGVRVTGVDDVQHFSDEIVVLITNMGKLTVKGSNLHINKLNVENGELTMNGRVDSLEYANNDKAQGSFFARLFK